MKKIIIVGGGFSGAALAVNLLRAPGPDGIRVQIIERRNRLGRGVAYSTWDDNHVLNVPAGNMSLYPDDPGHFVHYCQQQDPAFGPASFISRRLFGDYVENELEGARRAAPDRLQFIAGEAVAVRPARDGKGVEVELDGRSPLRADAAVLAFGHGEPRPPGGPWPAPAADFFINNPWSPTGLDGLGTDEPVAIIGSGHTAVDVLFSLSGRSDRRPVYLISRHGLLSQPHRTQTKAQNLPHFPDYLAACPATARAYAHALRAEIHKAAETGVDWRDVISPLRPYTAEIWHRWPEAERSRFLKWLVPYWDVHRHRLAPTAHHRLQDMIERGAVEVIAGRITGQTVVGNAVQLTVAARKTGLPRTVTVSRVINCTGPNYDLERSGHRLHRQLLADGLIRPDAQRIGLDTAANYAVIARSGEPCDRIRYLGPMLKAAHWEAIAVPELRNHARRLAEHLLAA